MADHRGRHGRDGVWLECEDSDGAAGSCHYAWGWGSAVVCGIEQ